MQEKYQPPNKIFGKMEWNGRKSGKLKNRALYTWGRFVQKYSKLFNKCSFGLSLLFREFFITSSGGSIFLLTGFDFHPNVS